MVRRARGFEVSRFIGLLPSPVLFARYQFVDAGPLLVRNVGLLTMPRMIDDQR